MIADDFLRLPYDLRAVSVHEAGHAVAAFLLGHRVTRAWVCRRAFVGRVQHRRPGCRMWTSAIVSAAGHAAELAVIGKIRNPGSDYSNICLGIRAVDRSAEEVPAEDVVLLERRVARVFDLLDLHGLILRVAAPLARCGKITGSELERVGGLALQDTLLRHRFSGTCRRLVQRFTDDLIVPRIAKELLRGLSRSELALEIAQ